MPLLICLLSLFFVNHTATTEIYTLSLHDALPIFSGGYGVTSEVVIRPSSWSISTRSVLRCAMCAKASLGDRKSTRLNSSHEWISYAVFCLKKKKEASQPAAGRAWKPGNP